jgi:CRP-like cAMP-binding protein
MADKLNNSFQKVIPKRADEATPPSSTPPPSVPPSATPDNSRSSPLPAYLAKLPLFAGVPPAILDQIAAQTKLLTLEKGDLLARAGEASDSLFVIRRGWIKIVADGSGGEEVVLNQCGPGQLIGEMALIDQQPRSNTMAAISSAEVLEIKYEVVLAALNQHPLLALSFLRDMSDRLRFANAYIEETIVWSQQIANGNYEFVQKRVQETQSTIVGVDLSYQARANAFLSAFFKMVEGVKQREEHLKQQVQELIIQIDEVKRKRAVAELTETEFFEDLQAAAQRVRAERAAREKRED